LHEGKAKLESYASKLKYYCKIGRGSSGLGLRGPGTNRLLLIYDVPNTRMGGDDLKEGVLLVQLKEGEEGF